MVITPTARGKTLKLLMSVCFNCEVITLGNMSSVVENCCCVAVFSDSTVCSLNIFFKNDSCVFFSVFFFFNIETEIFHICKTSFAVAHSGMNNIKEYTAGIVSLHNLFNLCAECIKITCIETKSVEMNFVSVFVNIIYIRRSVIMPFGMLHIILFIITC